MQRIMDLLKSRRLWGFVLAGTAGVAVDYALYNLFLWLGLPILPGKGLSFACGCCVGFFINKFWAFQSGGAVWAEAPRYALLYACTSLVNTGVNRLVLVVWPVTLGAFLCATAVSGMLNFLGLNFVVFRHRAGGEKREG